MSSLCGTCPTTVACGGKVGSWPHELSSSEPGGSAFVERESVQMTPTNFWPGIQGPGAPDPVLDLILSFQVYLPLSSRNRHFHSELPATWLVFHTGFCMYWSCAFTTTTSRWALHPPAHLPCPLAQTPAARLEGVGSGCHCLGHLVPSREGEEPHCKDLKDRCSQG